MAGLLNAARDPIFRQDLVRGLLSAGAGALQGLTTDALGAPVDLVNMALMPIGLGSPMPVGGSEWLQNKAIAGGLMAPPQDNLQYKAGRFLGPVAAMGIPDAAEALGRGLLGAASDFASHSGRLNPHAGQAGAITYHGSPHKFDAFDMSKIGTGEGAQAYGHGLYFADSPGVAKSYATALGDRERDLANNAIQRLIHINNRDPSRVRDALALEGFPRESITPQIESTIKKIIQNTADDGTVSQSAITAYRDLEKLIPNSGSLYTVDLPDEAIAKMLDWDKPLSEQAPEVRRALTELAKSDEALMDKFRALGPNATADQAYSALTEYAVRQKKYDGMRAGIAEEQARPSLEYGQNWATEQLRTLGIPGIRYLDGGSRGAGQGTYNYVVFDDKLPKILKRE